MSTHTRLRGTETAAAVRGKKIQPRPLGIYRCAGALVADICDRRLGIFPGRWRVLLGASSLPPLAQLLCALRTPESPRWLANRGAARYAQVVLGKLRSPAEAAAEAQELLAAAEAALREGSDEQQGAGSPAGGRPWGAPPGSGRSPPLASRALLSCVALQVLQQLAGVNAVAFFSTTVLEMAGFRLRSAVSASVVPAALGLLGSLCGCLLVDQVGRRPLLLLSAGGSAAALLMLSVSFFLADTVSPSVTDEMSAGPFRCKRAANTCSACLDSGCGFCLSTR